MKLFNGNLNKTSILTKILPFTIVLKSYLHFCKFNLAVSHSAMSTHKNKWSWWGKFENVKLQMSFNGEGGNDLRIKNYIPACSDFQDELYRPLSWYFYDAFCCLFLLHGKKAAWSFFETSPFVLHASKQARKWHGLDWFFCKLVL